MIDFEDYLIFAFLGWAVYDTIKDEGWLNGMISILIIVFFVLIVVLVPMLFGDSGKNVLLGLLILIVCYIGLKKYKDKNSK